MALTAEARKQLEDAMAAISLMRKNGQVTDAVYYKSLICIAYDFSEQDDLLKATDIINSIPPDYFETTQAQQMRDDVLYAKIGYQLARKLVNSGIVDLFDEKPNQPPANA